MPAERTGTPDIYADLERRLMTAGFASGAKLMPSALQHEYGCSANTVRDVAFVRAGFRLRGAAISPVFASCWNRRGQSGQCARGDLHGRRA